MSDKEYLHIECAKEHHNSECSFPKRVSTKLKMLFTIAVVSVAAVATFSGCASVRQDVQQTTTIPTTVIDMQAMKETTTKYNINENETTTIPITEQIAQENTQPTTKAPSTTEKITEEITEQTTKKATQQDTITTKKPVETTVKQTTNPATEESTKTPTKPENVNREYNQLLEQLNNELSKKAFSEEINKLFLDTFEALYKNYSGWQKGYKDLPNKSEYIKSKLTNVIKNIDDIKFYERGSEEANALLEQGYAGAWTELTDNNELLVSIIAKKSDKVDKYERAEDVEKFAHEVLGHCDQENILFNLEYFGGSEAFRKIILEGGATFHMKFSTPESEELTSARIIKNEVGTLRIEYSKSNGQGYLLELNAYEKLVYLVGYKTMEKVQKGEVPFSAINEAISQKYGPEQADKFMQTMEEWHSEYQNGYQSEKVYNLGIELENLFLNFIKKDINSLNAKDVQRFKTIHEFYKANTLSQVINTQTQENITNQVFGIEDIDKLLNDKIQEISKREEER